MIKYMVSVRFNGEYKEVFMNDYLLAYDIYRHFCKVYTDEACVDIVDNSTGEVFQSNQDI